jgi:hypothetical protein
MANICNVKYRWGNFRSTSNPEPNVDGSRTGNIDVSNHGSHQHDPSTANPSDNTLLQGNNVASAAATEIVLLTNMVGPGEVDDTLQHETADECGKYGKVERCLIFEVRATTRRMLLFACFSLLGVLTGIF